MSFLSGLFGGSAAVDKERAAAMTVIQQLLDAYKKVESNRARLSELYLKENAESLIAAVAAATPKTDATAADQKQPSAPALADLADNAAQVSPPDQKQAAAPAGDVKQNAPAAPSAPAADVKQNVPAPLAWTDLKVGDHVDLYTDDKWFTGRLLAHEADGTHRQQMRSWTRKKNYDSWM